MRSERMKKFRKNTKNKWPESPGSRWSTIGQNSNLKNKYKLIKQYRNITLLTSWDW